ncbi:MAG TPA: PKD domain-containing protein [Thermoplasmata archaeon]|nr:PKD domain-containing protein [Thermoplasmata archaeon]
MQRHLYRTASWVLVVVLLASSLAAILGNASATSTTYALTGFVDQPGGANAPPVPAGVTVDLISRATGAVFTTTVTGNGGQFTFTASGTSNALAPGYWGLYVPPAGNVSLTGCKRCGVLPQQQNPTFTFYSAAVLTNPNDTQILTNVAILPYTATLNGTVTLNGSSVAGASVRLISPDYAGFSLISNTTNASGFYNLSVPEGTWILQVSYSHGAQLYTNSTNVTITSSKPPHVNPTLAAFSISGRIYSSVTNSYVSTAGNATLYDPTNQYIYSTTTPVGGYYSFASYPANFSHGSQKFDLIVSPIGFQPEWFPLTVTGAGAITQKATVDPVKSSELGAFNTSLDLRGFSVATGKGQLDVNTSVVLGNDTVLPQLPNASVGQLWAQLGLDFNHTLTFPASTELATLETWVGSQGPFFPAVQALTTINGTGFIGPKTAQPAPTFGATCSTACGLNSGRNFSYAWQDNYTLNGTAPKSAGTYVISFGFAHPASSTEVYNYTLVLPKDYVLNAGTTAPAQTNLVGKGAQGTWTSFTLESMESSTPSATATFTIVKEAALTANVQISSTNTTFTSANILNSTHYGYTAVLGVGENATYSAAKSVYPAGLNGTKFEWSFGDKNYSNVTNLTTNHTYHKAGTYHGTLNIISSSGVNNSTTFNVSVVSTSPVAGIYANTTKAENKTVGTSRVLLVNWTRTLHFNANATTIASPNNLSISQFTLKAKNFTSSANFSVAKGANPRANWTVAFGSNTTNGTTAPGHGYYRNFANITIGGSATGLTGYGWVYNLTLTVWSLVGTNSTSQLTVLVNDTEKPAPKITLDTSAGKAITNGSIVEGPNHYAVVRLNASGSVDYGNGSVVKYVWNVNNSNSSTKFKNQTINATAVKPLPSVDLGPKSTAYKIKLTVTDKNGNSANATVSLQVAANTTLRPVLEANNLTGPSSVNAGTSYTYWVNVTVGGGAKSVAANVTVSFYLLSSSGTGSRTYVGGSPGSVVFYGYSNNTKYATVNTTSISKGTIESLKFNKTVRAVLTWSPGTSGSFILYANATATNQFVNGSSASVASTAVTVHPNPSTQLLEYGGIAAAVVVVLALLILYFRRRTRKPSSAKPSSSKSGLERTKHADDDEDA